MLRGKLKVWLLFFLLFAIIGYYRESFFVNLNNIIYMKYYNRTGALAVPGIMKVFERFSYDQLYYMKYPFTLVWTGIFFACNYFALKKLAGNDRLLRRILVISYILMLAMAFLAMGYGYFIQNRLKDDEYTLSRWLLGIAQSPLICLILLASEKLYRQTTGATRDV